jgi:hypothetical protein
MGKSATEAEKYAARHLLVLHEQRLKATASLKEWGDFTKDQVAYHQAHLHKLQSEQSVREIRFETEFETAIKEIQILSEENFQRRKDVNTAKKWVD